MPYQSLIQTYQEVLKTFRFQQPSSYSEDFAVKRFQKKFQEPDPNLSKILSDQCWSEWISNDKGLPELGNRLLLPEWYQARHTLHRACRSFRSGEFRFPKGSEFTPTRGHNSLESRLCSSDWTSTYENFESFTKICYNHKALKRAAKIRYRNWFRRKFPHECIRRADRLIYERLSKLGTGPVAFNIFAWKLRQIVTFTHGSRFSTVPKNNEQRRPINVEPFANTVVQGAIGNGIRNLINETFEVSLDHLPDVHRLRIADMTIATIDLKNASDSISWDLCRFLLPSSLFEKLNDSRSDMVLGPDGDFHVTKKISSMGNGFTFELMTLILFSITRVLDPKATVFGDDIIIAADAAPRLIQLLEDVGLKVNQDKTFISGPFRESCGGNFHKDEGYIESFDFEWPNTIYDCVMLSNKAFALSHYPSFGALHRTLLRCTPPALQGPYPPLKRSVGEHGRTEVNFPPFFISKNGKGGKGPGKFSMALKRYCYDPNSFRVVHGFAFVPKERTPCFRDLRSVWWAKYEMYLHAGRRSKDTIEGQGTWKEIAFVTSDKACFQASSLREPKAFPGAGS